MVQNELLDHYVSLCEREGREPGDEVPAELRPEVLRQLQVLRRLQPMVQALTTASASETAPVRPPSAVPREAIQLPGFELQSYLAGDGQGDIWRAVQVATRREVAIKIVRQYLSPQARARFWREVELTARLTHPHIVRVYHSSLDSDVPFYAMELIDGVPLDQYVQQANLSREALLKLMLAICRAVAFAHQRGIIHLDLKPRNILVDKEGQPHILDFGLARSLEARHPDDAEGFTLAYMSADQARGESDLDARSDVFSLGVILYRLLSGVHPFKLEGTIAEVRQRIADQPAPSMRIACKAIDPELDLIVMHALEPDREKRYGSAAALADDLERYLAHDPLSVRKPTLLYMLRKRVRKHRLKVLAGSVALAAVLVVAVVGVVRETQARLRAERAEVQRQQAEMQQRLTRAAELASSAGLEERRGGWEKALALYQEALQLGYPDSTSLQLHRVACFQAMGEADQMVAEVNQLARTGGAGPHAAQIKLWEGEVARLQGNPQKAEESIRAAIQGVSGSQLEPADLAYAKSMLALRSLEVLQLLEEASRHNPLHPWAARDRAVMLFVLGRLDEARQQAQLTRVLLPRDPMPDVIDAFEQIITGDTEGYARTRQRVREHSSEANLKVFDALSATVRQIRAADSGGVPIMALMQLAPYMKNKSGAGGMQAAMLRVPPSSSAAFGHFFSGLQAQQLGDHAKSAREYAAALDAQPDSVIYLAHGLELLDLQKLKEAEEAFSQSLKGHSLLPYRGGAVIMLAAVQVLRASGRAAPHEADPSAGVRAARTLRLAAQTEDVPLYAYGMLIDYALAIKDTGVARDLLATWRSRQPGGDGQTLKEAQIELADGGYGRAIARADEVLSKDPKQEKAREIRAKAVDELKKALGLELTSTTQPAQLVPATRSATSAPATQP